MPYNTFFTFRNLVIGLFLSNFAFSVFENEYQVITTQAISTSYHTTTADYLGSCAQFCSSIGKFCDNSEMALISTASGCLAAFKSFGYSPHDVHGAASTTCNTAVASSNGGAQITNACLLNPSIGGSSGTTGPGCFTSASGTATCASTQSSENDDGWKNNKDVTICPCSST